MTSKVKKHKLDLTWSLIGLLSGHKTQTKSNFFDNVNCHSFYEENSAEVKFVEKKVVPPHLFDVFFLNIYEHYYGIKGEGNTN